MKLYKKLIMTTVFATAAFNMAFGAIEGAYFSSKVYNNTDKALVFAYNPHITCKSKGNKIYTGKVVIQPREEKTVLDTIKGEDSCGGYLHLVAVMVDGKEVPVSRYSNPNDLELKFYGEGGAVMRGKIGQAEFIVNYFSGNVHAETVQKNAQGVEVKHKHKIFKTTITEQNLITLAAGGAMGYVGHAGLNAADWLANTGLAAKEMTYDLFGKAKNGTYAYANSIREWYNKKQ